MKNTEIKSLNSKELVESYKDERNLYQKLKFQNTVSQVDQPQKLKETRRNVARFLTEMNARRIESETQAYLKKMSEGK